MNRDDDPLRRVLERAGIATDTLDRNSANRLARSLGLDTVTADEFVRAIAFKAEWDDDPRADDELDFRVGRWNLDLRKEGSRAAIMALILSATFAATGIDSIGLALLAALVPSLFEIEDISLTDGEQRLLVDVRRLHDVTDWPARPDDIYDGLPDDVRMRLNRYDFADFLARLRETDLAVDDGDRIRVRGARENVPLVRWR